MFEISDSDSSDGDGAAPANVKKFSAVAAAAAAKAAAARKPARNMPSAAEIEAALSGTGPTPAAAPRVRATPQRESRYIGRLINRAEERREDMRIAADRRAALDIPDAETFVTASYARVLAGSEPEPAAPRARRARPLAPALVANPPPAAKRARRSRFADAEAEARLAIPVLRGVRRNNEEAIAAYRERYFERERARRAEKERVPASLSSVGS